MHQRAHPVLPFIPVDRYLGPIFISTFTPTDETLRAVGRKRKAGRLEGRKAGKLELAFDVLDSDDYRDVVGYFFLPPISI